MNDNDSQMMDIDHEDYDDDQDSIYICKYIKNQRNIDQCLWFALRDEELRLGTLLTLTSSNLRACMSTFPWYFQSVNTLEIIVSDIYVFSESIGTLLASLDSRSRLTSLDLSMTNLEPEDMTFIVDSLINNQSKPQLKKLNLQSNPLKNEGISLLCKLLDQSNSIQELILQCCEAEDGLELLGDIIGKNNQSLQYLDWSYNPSDYNNVMSLSSGVRLNDILETLLLRGCEIEGSGAYSLGDTVGVNQTLTKLDISDNRFGDGATTNLAKKLALNHSLTHLDISGNGFTCDSFNHLFSALHSHPTLTYLNLSRNDISTLDLINLTDIFQSNKKLDTLVMNDYNHFSNIHPLIDILSFNSSLESLNLFRNSLELESLITLLHFILKIPFRLQTTTCQLSIAQQMNVTRSAHILNYINITPKSKLSSDSYTKLNTLIKQSQSKITIFFYNMSHKNKKEEEIKLESESETDSDTYRKSKEEEFRDEQMKCNSVVLNKKILN
ncbi:hypothetical protein PPL_03575 [Heterostelium album PN500]|uniref:Uncharacterized protein n=1 Tax=Heterostelium pallidum (strain ATCC 26659 / Pp 5 / PN500) TaxID=670386 RepID=D3B563_HETP5|nr:hypothetical protein PPL_03575 [Heterostelium album PN500]EFA83428.1 hypothetical protein PPL_03575 [Heterostelium album PN500]|eukprot:XP_020435545.1 hypothetical protein PPL_03575 [Heterostelium album PN500]